MGWSFSAIVNGSMLMTGRESHYFELNLSTDTRLQWVLFKIPSTHFTVNGFQGRLKKPRPFPLAIIDSCFKIIFVTSFHVSPLLHRPLEPFESVLALVSSCIPPLHPPLHSNNSVFFRSPINRQTAHSTIIYHYHHRPNQTHELSSPYPSDYLVSISSQLNHAHIFVIMLSLQFCSTSISVCLPTCVCIRVCSRKSNSL